MSRSCPLNYKKILEKFKNPEFLEQRESLRDSLRDSTCIYSNIDSEMETIELNLSISPASSHTLSLLESWSIEDSPKTSTNTSLNTSPSMSPRLIRNTDYRPYITDYEWDQLSDPNGLFSLSLYGVKRLHQVFCFNHNNGYIDRLLFYDLLHDANPAFGHNIDSLFCTRLFSLFCNESNKGLTCVEWIIAVAILCNKASFMKPKDVLYYIFDIDMVTKVNFELIFADFDKTLLDEKKLFYKETTSKQWQYYCKHFFEHTTISSFYEFFNEKPAYITTILLIPVTLDWDIIDLILPIETP